MMNIKHICSLACALMLCFTTAGAQESNSDKKSHSKTKASKPKVSLSGTFLTLAHWRNDTDFDPSDRYDDLGTDRGSSGIISVPQQSLCKQGGVRVHYQAELG